MMKQFFIKHTLSLTSVIKPLLLRIFPVSFLQSIKQTLLSKCVLWQPDKYGSVSLACYPHGVNLIGNITGEIGLGQSCRLVALGLSLSNYPFSVYNYLPINSIRNTDKRWHHAITNETPYGINLIHINPYEMIAAHCSLPRNIWEQHYNIGFWLWELEDFPEEWTACFHLVHEIWTPAEFVSKSIRKKTNLPVYTMPYALEAPIDKTISRSSLGLPENEFLFLCMYDCNSTALRKNPMGAIAAFEIAFGSESGVGLVVKINNPQEKDLVQLRASVQHLPNVYFITNILQKTAVNTLLSIVDVFVSLHRAEGFGLVLAEAMWLGTPVVGTNWSANTEFMTADNSCLIDFAMVTIEHSVPPYQAGNRWADPDVNAAAAAMKRLYQDPEYYHQLSEKATNHVQQLLSGSASSKRMEKRIEEIYEEHTG